ncbi:GNAT family N-acetyltransferase [Cyclobacterium amurskyense]|uniref:Acetyltransferase, GNAT family n=1 Tax=Cyclobacterium amurskyense TaxID=320787 RepID=A0A0H4PHA9_9BACT|nr:GNAT family N-acetyltransferase [Cyclobacterium amurskyense]AKP52430.1 Acetyltransferase, GNAT family [Cyclobacterium amurskyense]
MAKIERLNWDSDFFGYEVGRLDLINSDEFNVEKFISESSSFKLVYILSKKTIPYEFITLVDRKIIYRKDDISNVGYNSFKNRLISFDENLHDKKQLIELALASGIYSRYNIDSNFNNNEYTKLYTRWILNSINKEIAFEVLIALENKQILGFITIGKINSDLADIGLIAVHPDARGRGIGTELINSAIEMAKSKNFKRIQVVTQSENIPACNLYQKANFKEIDITNIYHYWNL